MILAELFQGKRDGCFVDVGAHHPKRFSNTYHFYRFRGWRGVNIDATPGSMRAFQRSRPDDVNVEAAVSDVPQTLQFFIFNEPALNTFDPKMAAERDGVQGYHVVRTVQIQTRTLASLLGEQLPANRAIDFLSVDVEGLDLQVLRSNDWQRFRPTLVLAEDVTASSWKQIGTSAVTHFLEQQGYEPFARTPRTTFYQLSSSVRS